MRKILLCTALILATITLSAAEWGGVYRWSAAPTEQAGIKAAVEAGCAQVNFALRGIARKRLTEGTRAYQQLTFKVDGQQITCLRDNDNPIVSPADGSPASWKRIDGKLFQVAQKIDGNVLKQIFIDDDGSTRTNVFSLDAAGLVLQMQAELASKSLKRPISFTLTYQRQ